MNSLFELSTRPNQDAAGACIVVLGTGGTIAGTAAASGDNIGYTAAQRGVAELLQAIPPLHNALRGCKLRTEQVAQVDSKDMGWAVWQPLLARTAEALADPAVRGVIITHGTDTLEETAYLLHAVLRPSKPVVLVSAMRPATALTPDGPQNLLDALAVLHDAAAQGVMAVCAGALHSAREVCKRHPYRVDAFDSGDAGPLAYIEEGALRWLRSPPLAQADISALWPHLWPRLAQAHELPRVDVITSHADADGRVVDLLVQDGVRGLVVAGTGNGTVHQRLLSALERAQAAGVWVWRASRCAQGRVLRHAGDAWTGIHLPEAEGLSPVKARIALMLALLAEAE
mgnify:FL=1